MKKIIVKLSWSDKEFFDASDNLSVKVTSNGELQISARKKVNSTMYATVVIAVFKEWDYYLTDEADEYLNV